MFSAVAFIALFVEIGTIWDRIIRNVTCLDHKWSDNRYKCCLNSLFGFDRTLLRDS